jgi:hypothetical protein
MTVALSAPNDERISVRLLDFRRQSAPRIADGQEAAGRFGNQPKIDSILERVGRQYGVIDLAGWIGPSPDKSSYRNAAFGLMGHIPIFR